MNPAKDSTSATTGGPTRPTTLDPRLLAVLACPEDKGPLYYVAAENLLYNPRLQRRYDIVEGIPVMLVEEATTVDDAEHVRLLALIERDGIAPTFEPAQ